MSKETSSCKYRIFLLCQVTYNVQWEDGIYSTYFFGGERECGGVCISFSVSLDHKRVYTDVCHPISFLVFSLFQVALRHLLFLWVLSGIWLPSFHQWQTWGHGNLCRAVKGPISPSPNIHTLTASSWSLFCLKKKPLCPKSLLPNPCMHFLICRLIFTSTHLCGLLEHVLVHSFGYFPAETETGPGHKGQRETGERGRPLPTGRWQVE